MHLGHTKLGIPLQVPSLDLVPHPSPTIAEAEQAQGPLGEPSADLTGGCDVQTPRQTLVPQDLARH